MLSLMLRLPPLLIFQSVPKWTGPASKVLSFSISVIRDYLWCVTASNKCQTLSDSYMQGKVVVARKTETISLILPRSSSFKKNILGEIRNVQGPYQCLNLQHNSFRRPAEQLYPFRLSSYAPPAGDLPGQSLPVLS